MKRDPLDKLLRNRLAQHAAPVDGEAAWAAFERLRTPPPKKRRRGAWWLFALAGWLLAGGGLALYLLPTAAPVTQAFPVELPAADGVSLLPPARRLVPRQPPNANPPVSPVVPDPAPPITAATTEGTIPKTSLSAIVPTDLTPRSTPAPTGAGAVVGTRPPVIYRQAATLNRLPHPTTLDPFQLSKPLLDPSFAPGPRRQRGPVSGWTIGAGAGYGAHLTRYRARNGVERAYRQRRRAAETPLDLHFTDLYAQVYFKRGWFVRLGGQYCNFQQKTEQSSRNTRPITVEDGVIRIIQQPDGSTLTETGTVRGEQIIERNSRVYYRDQRIGLLMGGGQRWLLPNRSALEWYGGLRYDFHHLPAGSVLAPDGELRIRAAGLYDTKEPVAAQAQLHYYFARHYQIGLFAETDVVAAGAHGLQVYRAGLGLRLGVRW